MKIIWDFNGNFKGRCYIVYSYFLTSMNKSNTVRKKNVKVPTWNNVSLFCVRVEFFHILAEAAQRLTRLKILTITNKIKLSNISSKSISLYGFQKHLSFRRTMYYLVVEVFKTTDKMMIMFVDCFYCEMYSEKNWLRKMYKLSIDAFSSWYWLTSFQQIINVFDDILTKSSW